MAGLIEGLRDAGSAWARNCGVRLQGVEPGVAYVRRKTWGVIETARVSQVIEDASGVRHIRFDLSSRHHDRSFDHGPRTMGLQSFMRLYRRQA